MTRKEYYPKWDGVYGKLYDAEINFKLTRRRNA